MCQAKEYWTLNSPRECFTAGMIIKAMSIPSIPGKDQEKYKCYVPRPHQEAFVTLLLLHFFLVDRQCLGLFWFYCLVLVLCVGGFFGFWWVFGIFPLCWIVVVVVFGALYLFFCALRVFC